MKPSATCDNASHRIWDRLSTGVQLKLERLRALEVAPAEVDGITKQAMQAFHVFCSSGSGDRLCFGLVVRQGFVFALPNA